MAYAVYSIHSQGRLSLASMEFVHTHIYAHSSGQNSNDMLKEFAPYIYLFISLTMRINYYIAFIKKIQM